MCSLRRPFVSHTKGIRIVTHPSPARTAGPDGQDVESTWNIPGAAHGEIIPCRIHYMGQFQVFDGSDGINQGVRLPRADLSEYQYPLFECYDVDLSSRAQIVSLKDAVTAEKKVKSC